MEVVYKLWEGSWEDDAVLRDRARGVFADPAKVHRVRHEGTIYLARRDPSQRAFAAAHAGAVSGRRVAARPTFAARHAECVFMSGPSPQVIAPEWRRSAQRLTSSVATRRIS